MRGLGGLARVLTRGKAPPRGRAPDAPAGRSAGPALAGAGKGVEAWRLPKGWTSVQVEARSKPTPWRAASGSVASAGDAGKPWMGGGFPAGSVPAAAGMGISGSRSRRGSCFGVVAVRGLVPAPPPVVGMPRRKLSQGRVQGKLKDMPESSSTALQKDADADGAASTTKGEMSLLMRATGRVIMEVLSGKKTSDSKNVAKKFEAGLDGEDGKKEGGEEEGKKEGKKEDKERLMSAEGRSTITRVISLVGPEKRVLGIAVATIAVTTPISLFFPMAVGKLLDVATSADPVITPITVMCALFGVFTLQGLMMSVRDGLLSVAGERMAARLRRQTFQAVLRQEMAFFDATRTGELLNRLASDTSVVQKAITNNVASALRSVGMVFGCTAMLLVTSPKLSLVSLLVLPPGGVIAVYMGRFMKRKQSEVQDALARTSQQAEEVIGAMRTVQQFTREADEAKRYGDVMAETRELATAVGIANSLLGTAIHVAANVSLACVLGYGGTLVVAGEMTAGVLTSFLLYSVYLGFNVGSLSGIYGDLMKAVGASQRIFSLLDREAGLPSFDSSDSLRGKMIEGYTGGIEFKDVVFRYPSRPASPILQGLNIKVEAGQIMGIVGASGSGKSTVGALLTRLYDPEAGSVLLDGYDIRDLSPRWVRSVVAAVPQEPVLFAVSIADNIRYGQLDASDEEVRRVAQIANVDSFVRRFPDGYDTFVGERGLQLSGGQKQRLAIARALIKKPKILLLDEATSALDSESERLVQEAISRVSHQGMAVVKIAHRLNTIKDADVIAVLDEGVVVESGSYAQLLSNGGAFKDLMSNQTA